jgi:hypothetical protein
MVSTVELINGYFCVFVGKSIECTPYACFSTMAQAEIFHRDINSMYPIITFGEWNQIYKQPEVKP